MYLAILTLSCVSIPTMREDRNPPREDSVLAMPNMVPATVKALSELCLASSDVTVCSFKHKNMIHPSEVKHYAMKAYADVELQLHQS
jgi:hypothetical protein